MPLLYRKSVITSEHTLCVNKNHWFWPSNDVIIGAKASQITSPAIVNSTVYSDADQRKHQSSTSLAFVCGIHRWPVNSPHKWPVTLKMFPFDDVIMVHTVCAATVFIISKKLSLPIISITGSYYGSACVTSVVPFQLCRATSNLWWRKGR